MINARMELSLTITELPTDVVEKDEKVTFGVTAAGRSVFITVSTKVWGKMTRAAEVWPERWKAHVSGKMGKGDATSFDLFEASTQVYEIIKKKEKKKAPAPAAGAEAAPPAPAPPVLPPPAPAPPPPVLKAPPRVQPRPPIVEYRRPASRDLRDVMAEERRGRR